MKSFLILILTASLSLAEVHSMLVENIPANSEKAAHAKVSAYGLLSNGQPKIFELLSTADKTLSSNVENCKWGGEEGLNRSALRYWVFFNESEVSKIDIHMSEQWDQKIIEEFDEQMKTQIKKLKDFIEGK